MNKHKEIIKAVKDIVDKPLSEMMTELTEKQLEDIATAIEKIYDIKYLGYKSINEHLELNWRLIRPVDFHKVANELVKLAIPECDYADTIKDLEADLELEEDIAIARNNEISDLKAKCKELEDSLKCSLQINKSIIKKYDKLEAEVNRLKGIISRGETMLENSYDKLNPKVQRGLPDDAGIDYDDLDMD